jgi:hypothetical protein
MILKAVAVVALLLRQQSVTVTSISRRQGRSWPDSSSAKVSQGRPMTF